MYVTYYALYQSLSLSLSVWRVIFNYETRRGKNDGKYRIFFARRVVKKSNIFSFFFFSKNFARTKRWYNRIDWPMPAGISLSPLSFVFVFFLHFDYFSRSIAPWNRQSVELERIDERHAPRHFYARFLPRSTRHRENSISSEQFLDRGAPRPPPIPR